MMMGEHDGTVTEEVEDEEFAGGIIRIRRLFENYTDYSSSRNHPTQARKLICVSQVFIPDVKKP